MMEITDKTITLVGVVAIAGIACVTFAVGQIAVGSTCIGIIGGVLGTGGITTKKAEAVQATEDTPSDLSTDDLVSEVDNSISTTDTTTSTVARATVEGLSDEYIQKVVEATIKKMSVQAQRASSTETSTETVLTQ